MSSNLKLAVTPRNNIGRGNSVILCKTSGNLDCFQVPSIKLSENWSPLLHLDWFNIQIICWEIWTVWILKVLDISLANIALIISDLVDIIYSEDKINSNDLLFFIISRKIFIYLVSKIIVAATLRNSCGETDSKGTRTQGERL